MTISWDFFEGFIEMAFFELWVSFLKKKFFRTKQCFFFEKSSEMEQKNLDFWEKIPARLPEFCSISPEEQIEVDNVVKKKHSFVFFRLWAKNCGKLPKKLLAAFSKLHIKSPGIFFHHFYWWSMTYFVSFRHLAEHFWRVYRNVFLWALRIVWKEKSSFEQRNVFFFLKNSDLEQKSSRFSAKNTGKVAKILIN